MTQGTTYQRFSYDASGNVLSVDYSNNSGSTYTTYYYLRNGQGDIVKLIDNSGSTVVEYKYDSWGKQLSCTGSLSATVGLNQPFRYRGYVYDTETGWYYLQSRYYNPEVGRFISADVYLSTGQGVLGHNAYAYCNNNPVNMADDAGTAPRDARNEPNTDTTSERNLDIKRKCYAITIEGWYCETIWITESLGYDSCDVTVFEVSSMNEFFDAWNIISEQQETYTVLLNMHGSALSICDEDDFEMRILDVARLKSINPQCMYLLGCNCGHIDVASNIANAFAAKPVVLRCMQAMGLLDPFILTVNQLKRDPSLKLKAMLVAGNHMVG